MVLTSPLFASVVLALHLPVVAQVSPTAPSVDAPATTAPVEVEVPAPVVGIDVTTDDVERALLLLSGYHGIPTAEELEAALSDPQTIMFAIISDPDVSAIHRDRAIGALAYWPDATVQAYFAGVLAAPDTPEMMRHRVIGHIATAFGDDAIALIAPYLDDEDLQFRLTAVHALGHIGTPAAMQRLEAAAQVEASNVVLEQIQELGGVR